MKLYDKLPYETTFEAKVLEVTKSDKGSVVVLEQTLFFPEEGGQNSDTGILCFDGKECRVLHVSLEKRDGKEILCHLVDTDELSAGMSVCGKLDWTARYDKMQNHTGEHILSGIVHSEFGFDNVGFHLNDEIFTMDFNGVLDAEKLQFLEEKANQIVAENVKVYGAYVPREELADLEYRSKKEIDGEVRIVTVEGYDKCACCAPHVANTIEVGVIKIIKAENWKGGMRLTVLCGSRAYKDYAGKHRILQNMSRSFSTSEEKLPDLVEGLKKQVSDLEFKMAALECQMATEKLLTNSVQFFEALSPKALTKTMDDVMKQKPEEMFMVFVGNDESGYRYVVGSQTQDVAVIVAKMREKLGAKGGGRGVMLQGMVNAKRSEIEGCIGC